MRKVEAQWGDGLKGMRYQQARKALEQLEQLDGQTHIKNWRPQVLLLCKPGVQSQTVAHPKLLSLLKQLKGFSRIIAKLSINFLAHGAR